jgi:hypothetical protein
MRIREAQKIWILRIRIRIQIRNTGKNKIFFNYRCLFRPEFWVSVSDVPGRSFLLFEWFEPRHTETEKEFAARQKIEQADHVQFFYLQEKLKKELLINCPPYVIKKTLC